VALGKECREFRVPVFPGKWVTQNASILHSPKQICLFIYLFIYYYYFFLFFIFLPLYNPNSFRKYFFSFTFLQLTCQNIYSMMGKILDGYLPCPCTTEFTIVL